MLARTHDAELQVFPRPRRWLWLWGVLGGLSIAVGLMAIGTCRDDREEDRPKVAPVLPAGEGLRR